MELKTIFKCIILHLLKIYKASYTRPLKSNKFKFLLTWIYSHTKRINDYPKLTIQTRICWVLHNYNDFPACKYCGKYIDIWFRKNIPATHEYPKYCRKHAHCNNDSRNKIKQTLQNMPQEHWDNSLEKRKKTCLLNYGYEYVAQVPEIIDKSTKSFLTKYGVKRYSQLPEWKEKTIKANRQQFGTDWESQSQHGHNSRLHTIQNRYGQTITCVFQIQSIKNKINVKAYTKYKYNNILFDSSPELAFFIWLTDHNIRFLYHSKNHKFIYQLDGKNHTYYPDFYLIDYDRYIEIKGDQFFDKNNNYINPYNLKHPEIAYAKYECMIKNNVIIFRNQQYKIFIDYVSQHYGKTYLKSFKQKSKVNKLQ